MEPIIVSKADYDAGNYPKDTPIMIAMDVGMAGRGGMDVGKKEKTNIKVTLKTNQ